MQKWMERRFTSEEAIEERKLGQCQLGSHESADLFQRLEGLPGILRSGFDAGVSDVGPKLV